MADARLVLQLRGQTLGPIPKEQLAALLASGQVLQSDRAWPADMPQHLQPPTLAEVLEFPLAADRDDYAGFGWRVLACWLDWIIIGPAWLASIFLAVYMDENVTGIAGDLAWRLPWIWLVASWWAYYTLLDCSRLQGTLGKWLLGLRVTDTADVGRLPVEAVAASCLERSTFEEASTGCSVSGLALAFSAPTAQAIP